MKSLFRSARVLLPCTLHPRKSFEFLQRFATNWT
jgi:hypothetical protein